MKLNGMMLAAMILTGACSAPAANGPRPEASYFSSAERHETASPAMIERNYLACLVSDNNGSQPCPGRRLLRRRRVPPSRLPPAASRSA